ncbi:MAG: ferredoxin [Solirubrobacterales bacterium]|jgi:ferredoxin|nr:ferredoxin [Solirubrobacterales bacterium]
MVGMNLKVHIDKDACLAYGDCAELAPGAFQVKQVAKLVGRAPAQQLIDAARACPSEAITLIDADTGEPVYP